MRAPTFRRGGGGGILRAVSPVARPFPRRAAFAVAALAALAACDPDPGATLAVDLRTDLVPGVEFVGVRSALEAPRVSDERAARVREDYFAGQRVAELDGIPNGTRALVVSLLGPTGEVVVERRVLVRLDGPLVTTVLVTRDCGRGVRC